MKDPFKEFLKEFKYDKGINNVYSLAKLDGGIICPNDPLDLKKIFKTCEKMSETYNNIVGNFKFDEKEIFEIIENCKFENFSDQENKRGFIDNSATNKNFKKKFFRLGPRNNWKNLLANDIRIKIENSFRNEMTELGYL